MTVYSKKATPAQRRWLKDYESATTFEPMYQEDLDSGEKTFAEIARDNIQWFQRWFGDAMNAIPDPELVDD